MKKIFLIILITIYYSHNCFSQSFKKTIAMHESANRPNEEARDNKVNTKAPITELLKLAKIGTFNSLNPYIIKGIAPPGIKGLVIESLMTWSPDEPFSLYPGIAEGIITPQDRSWVEFKINPHAQFSNGKKITNKDIIFSWETLKKYGRPHTRSYYSLVKDVKEITSNIVRFTFSEKSNFEMPLIIGLMPVFSSAYWKKRDFTKTTLEPFISSGPYLITEIKAGRSITYTKNKSWWRENSQDSLGRNNFNKIKYDFYRDTNVSLQAFLSGEYDVNIETDAVRWVTAYHENPKNKIIKKTFQKQSPSGIEGIILNSRQFPFKDRNVRKAISILFPYNFINEILNHGLLKQTYGPWDNSDLAATSMPSETTNEILKKYKDIISINALERINNKEIKEREAFKKSLSLFKKSGWQLINKKMTNIDTKEILKFEIITNQSRMKRLLLVWKDKLKKIGITLSIKILDSSQFQNRIQSFNFNAIIFEYYMSLSPGNEQSIYWGSWAANQQGSRNYAGIKHPAIDEVIKKISNAKNRSELIEYTKTLDRLIRAGHWIIPLYHDPLHRIAYKSGLQIPNELPLYGFNPWTTWQK